MFSILYCLRQVVNLCYELLVVLIWLWEILVAFENILRFGPVLLLYDLSHFCLFCLGEVFWLSRHFWLWFLSMETVYATSKCKECVKRPHVIITKSSYTSFPKAVQKCALAACTSWYIQCGNAGQIKLHSTTADCPSSHGSQFPWQYLKEAFKKDRETFYKSM